MPYTPISRPENNAQLREQYAGNPRMQERLAQDDRYYFGRESPLNVLSGLAAQIPYDLLKTAYFSGPPAVSNLARGISEQLLPEQGFNPRTTSRPTMGNYRALLAAGNDHALEALNSLAERTRSLPVRGVPATGLQNLSALSPNRSK